MKGDFSRDTFDPSRHFSRVLMQQGRVLLDADWNEQAAILLHYLRTLAEDLIGPHGGPSGEAGFKIETMTTGISPNLRIGSPGRYYVEGVLCEIESQFDGQGSPKEWTYYHQPSYVPDREKAAEQLPVPPYLVYLDVWERSISWLEDWRDSEPGIREVALGEADTCVRAQVIWQVKVSGQASTGPSVDRASVQDDDWSSWVEQWQPPHRGELKARAQRKIEASTDPCTIPPDARYRGAENQLYRVEIHKPGVANTATFKWSRENGSVVFPVRDVTPGTSDKSTIVELEHLGTDERSSLRPGDWVEIVDDAYVWHNRAEPLLLVKIVDHDTNKVTLEGEHGSTVGADPKMHPLLRRWDHRASDPNKGGVELDKGAAKIKEGTADESWLMLENGVQIQFQPSGNYRTGDYWLIPARTATRDIEWPGTPEKPTAKPPDGIDHHYAPLWIITQGSDGNAIADATNDCRRLFADLFAHHHS